MSSKPFPALQGRKILVVEDEMMIAMEYESLLEDEGYDVVGPASSCSKALSLIEHGSIDACVLDLNLNGKPVTSIARELNRLEIPFVLVSGYSHSELEDPELEGARRLTKPVEEKKLLMVLGEILEPATFRKNLSDGATLQRE